MAGFLRKKSKQDPRPKPGSAQPPLSSPPAAAPLFARFATSKQAQEGPRIVSSPMQLSSSRKEAAAPTHVRGSASQAAVQSQLRDGNSRGSYLPENNREVNGGHSARYSTRGAAGPPQNMHGGMRTQQDQAQRDNRTQYPAENARTNNLHQASPSSSWGAAAPSNQFGGSRGQAVVQPRSNENTRENAGNFPMKSPQQRLYPENRVSMVDKSSPPSAETGPPRLNELRPLSENHPSPIQGEYAHLWSMIAGDDVQLPDIQEGSSVNPATNAPRKALAQESPSRNHNSNVAVIPDLAASVGSSNILANSHPSGAPSPSPPIASHTLSEPEVDLRSQSLPPPQPYPTSPQASPAEAGFSAPSSHRTTSYIDTDEKPSKPQKSYENANINDVPVIPEPAPLSTSPSANRKLSKSTKPIGQAALMTRSASAQRENTRPGSQPAQDEVHTSYYPPSHIMGANISAPDVSGIQHAHRPLYKEPAIIAPNNQRHLVAPPPPAFVASQKRMSVQYPPPSVAPSPPRKSSSVRTPTGKPLIFTAMASVDQRVAPTDPGVSRQPVLQYRNWPDNGAPPHHQAQHQHEPQHQNQPHAQIPPQPQLRAQQSTPNGHGSQVGSSVTHPSSATSQNGPSVSVPSFKGPLHPSNFNGPLSPPAHHESPTPSIRQGPNRTRRPSKAVDPSHPSAAGAPIDQHQRTHVKVGPNTPISPGKAGPIQIDGDTLGVPLDDDPFAKAEGVKMLVPTVSRPPSLEEGMGKRGKPRDGQKDGEELNSDSASFEPSRPGSSAKFPTPSPMSSNDELRRTNGQELATSANEDLVMVSPPIILGEKEGNDYLTAFLGDVNLLGTLLGFFTFYDWCMILSLSRDIRFMIVQNPMLRETVLERFLKTVGYTRWAWNEPDPLSLSLQDLNDYMRGVSTPTHEYARIAALYNHSLFVHPSHRDQSLYDTVRHLAASTRAYTRVVLRLRAQGEKEVAIARARGPLRSGSRPQSRASSPTFSHSNHSHGSVQNSQYQPPSRISPVTFQSPLFRLKRAPLLRVFVPSPDGDWLSDKSVLECEAELRRAGVTGLMRLGDVVWDVAVGDEGNVGRLAWDGSYLIDLDYTYSAVGDLPKYMPTFAFPPSYFHRVIRTGPNSSNPIAHMDLRPWGEEIAANLQLLQDRVRTETPQGAYHNVVRWVHRSSFVIRPPGRGAMRPPMSGNHHSTHLGPARVPIPESNLFVDPGWYGTIVVETEGTNESLADLQDRCGPGAFPPRPTPVNGAKATNRDSKLVFRILREKSRPGEIWIRAVSPKERIL
ncbi:hypothetical protein H0H87_007551 [Tephrocybe sp. NHM501043]|nr:hypothetical protein H0H87_007551 [Tephrocybe sp. NHM501043]